MRFVAGCPALKLTLVIFSIAGVKIWGGDLAAAADPNGKPKVYKSVDGRDLHLYVVYPSDWKPEERRPAILFFHGGGYVGGSPGQFNEATEYFAARGLVCIMVEYRLLERGSKVPPVVCLEDGISAMQYVRDHAAELGIDPDRVAAGGGSAGGHLAGFLGIVDRLEGAQIKSETSWKPNALILFNPVLDNGPKDGYGYERVGDRYRSFSPAHNVSDDDPPTIVFLGTNDRLVPVEVMERFRSKMERAGVPCEVSYAKDQPHGFFNREPWRSKTLGEAERFLQDLGWIDSQG